MKQHKTIRRFYFRCALLALPFLLLGVLYVVEDPFMVLRRYADYDHPKVCQSEGTVSWLKYKAKVSHPSKHCLFSFTFVCRPPYSLTFNT